jgi:uncharacterized protein DUF4058
VGIARLSKGPHFTTVDLFWFRQEVPTMPSPFPGMDPYLEAPHIWPDLHNALAAELRKDLNQTLPNPYYARLEMRPELGVSSDPIHHQFVEIRDSSQGHKLITLIEIVSPSNKRLGPDREAYERKQREVFDSDASLVEIDLLRGGRRILPDPGLDALIHDMEQPPAYLVLINRAWRRTPGTSAYQVFPVSLHEWLPCIPVPLKENENEVTLDLQFAFNRAYDSGRYRRGAVDYASPPPEPLMDAAAAWAAELTQPWRVAPPAVPQS